MEETRVLGILFILSFVTAHQDLVVMGVTIRHLVLSRLVTQIITIVMEQIALVERIT